MQSTIQYDQFWCWFPFLSEKLVVQWDGEYHLISRVTEFDAKPQAHFESSETGVLRIRNYEVINDLDTGLNSTVTKLYGS